MLVALELEARDLARRAGGERHGHEFLVCADERMRVDADVRGVAAHDEGRALRHIPEGVAPDGCPRLGIEEIEHGPVNEATVVAPNLAAYEQTLGDELHLRDVAPVVAGLGPRRAAVAQI